MNTAARFDDLAGDVITDLLQLQRTRLFARFRGANARAVEQAARTDPPGRGNLSIESLAEVAPRIVAAAAESAVGTLGPEGRHQRPVGCAAARVFGGFGQRLVLA